MIGTISVAIVAAAGAYAGSTYAVSRGGQMTAPEATAQAYRDLLGAIVDLRRTCVDINMAQFSGQSVDEAKSAWNLAGGAFSRVVGSVGFLIPMSDLDILESIIQSFNLPIDERIDALDGALADLRKSANRTFSRR